MDFSSTPARRTTAGPTSRRRRAGRLVAAAVASGLALLTSVALPAHADNATVRINARWGSVVDGAGRTWAGRVGFEGARVNRSDGLAGKPIAGTTDDILYQSNVWGMTSFRRELPNGDYRVRLLMAEDYHQAAGRRVFDVTAEGRPVLSKVDIVGAVGARATAYDRTFTTRVTDRSLDLGFVAVADNPLVSAIEIVRVAKPGETAPTPAKGGTYGTGSIDKGGLGTKPNAPGTGVADTVDEFLAATVDVSGGGIKPTLVDGLLKASAGGGDSRSEVFWGTMNSGRYRWSRGTTVTTEFQLRHRFSDPVTGAMPNPATWHTIYQLHGPTLANSWPAPPVSIAWQNGTYRVGGGAAVPTTTGALTYRGSWYQPYAPAPENVWRTIKVTTYLEGPARGWMSVWIDGQPYMTKWKPVAGTMYTDSGAYSHKEISLKSGLYTATKSPTWSRWVEQRDMRVTVTTAAGTTVAIAD